MNIVIHNAIKKIYKDKDYSYYRKQVQRELKIKKYIDDICSRYGKYDKEDDEKDWPSLNWSIKHRPIQIDYFGIEYRTEIIVSKIVRAIYICYTFEVPNLVSNRIEPTLNGASESPYTGIQKQLQKAIKVLAQKYNYIILSTEDMETTFPELAVPVEENGAKDIQLYSHASVDALLFHDELGILEMESII